MGTIAIKRIYETPAFTDGTRVLVDRIWPRGVSKEMAKLDLWLKSIAPSPELRNWFDHEPSRFEAFADRYRKELSANTDAVTELVNIATQGNVTLLYAARNRQVNHAVVLAKFLASRGLDIGDGEHA